MPRGKRVVGPIFGPGYHTQQPDSLICGRRASAGRGGLGLFGVADLAGFVDFLSGQARVGDLGFPDILFGNFGAASQIVGGLCHFAPLLRGVIFVGQPALGPCESGILSYCREAAIRSSGFLPAC